MASRVENASMSRILPMLLVGSLLAGCGGKDTAPAAEPVRAIAPTTAVAAAATEMVLGELPATVVQPPG
ncbi:MAG: hypothetical protein RIS17_1092, partial [Pseudomonadota bacterium]